MDRIAKLCLATIIVLAGFVGAAKAEIAYPGEVTLHESFEFSVDMEVFQSVQGERFGLHLGPHFEIAPRFNLGVMAGVETGSSGALVFSNPVLRTQLSYAWNEKLGWLAAVRVNGKNPEIGLFIGAEFLLRKSSLDVIHFSFLAGQLFGVSAAGIGTLVWSFY